MGAAAKDYSLHIGPNYVDRAYCEGRDGALNAGEADADDMEALAAEAGCSIGAPIREQATREAVKGCGAESASDTSA